MRIQTGAPEGRMLKSNPKVYLSQRTLQTQGRTTLGSLRVEQTYMLAKSPRAIHKCDWCLPAPRMFYRFTNRKARTATTHLTSTKTKRSSPRTRAQHIKIRMWHGTWTLGGKAQEEQIATFHSISLTVMKRRRRTEKKAGNISPYPIKTLGNEMPLQNLPIYQWLSSIPRSTSQVKSMRMNLTLKSRMLMAT